MKQIAIKEFIKLSEAKIIVYLENTDVEHKFTLRMATKLNMDYGYIIKILNLLENKEWIKSAKIHGKRFYELTTKGKKYMQQAKQKIIEG